MTTTQERPVKVADEQELTHLLRITDRNGYTEKRWNPTDPKSTSEAKAAFDTQITENAASASSVDTDDKSKGEVIHTFDPQAYEIVVTPQIVGG